VLEHIGGHLLQARQGRWEALKLLAENRSPSRRNKKVAEKDREREKQKVTSGSPPLPAPPKTLDVGFLPCPGRETAEKAQP